MDAFLLKYDLALPIVKNIEAGRMLSTWCILRIETHQFKCVFII